MVGERWCVRGAGRARMVAAESTGQCLELHVHPWAILLIPPTENLLYPMCPGEGFTCISSSNPPKILRWTIIPIVQMRKLRHRRVK